MITEIPTAQEFKDAGANLLHLAWDVVMDLVRWSDESHSGSVLYDDMLEEYWQRSQTALGNAFSLIQQSMELGIKGRIAAVSPFILISSEHSKWGQMPFSEFRTIDATDLIKVHNAVSAPPLDDKFRDFFDDIRRKRNKLMHSVPKDTFDADILIVSVLTAAETLYNEPPWSQRCIQHEAESRISVLDGGDSARNRVLSDFDLAIKTLKPAQAKRFFAFDRKQYAYICPSCYSVADHSYTDDFPRSAQLRSKDAGETLLDCKVCGVTSTVQRKPCGFCKCTVLDDEGMCLVCQEGA